MQWFHHTLIDEYASRITAEETPSPADRVAPPIEASTRYRGSPIGLGLAQTSGFPAARQPNFVLFHLIVLKAPAVFSLHTAHSPLQGPNEV
jgi:hypothetical protein